MTLFRTAAPQHSCHDWLKDLAKTVVKHDHQKQSTNILNNQYIKSVKRLTGRKGENSQRFNKKSANQKMLIGIVRKKRIQQS